MVALHGRTEAKQHFQRNRGGSVLVHHCRLRDETLTSVRCLHRAWECAHPAASLRSLFASSSPPRACTTPSTLLSRWSGPSSARGPGRGGAHGGHHLRTTIASAPGVRAPKLGLGHECLCRVPAGSVVWVGSGIQVCAALGLRRLVLIKSSVRPPRDRTIARTLRCDLRLEIGATKYDCETRKYSGRQPLSASVDLCTVGWGGGKIKHRSARSTPDCSSQPLRLNTSGLLWLACPHFTHSCPNVLKSTAHSRGGSAVDGEIAGRSVELVQHMRIPTTHIDICSCRSAQPRAAASEPAGVPSSAPHGGRPRACTCKRPAGSMQEQRG